MDAGHMPMFHADGKTSTEAEAVATNSAERENDRRNATERAGRIDATELQPQLGDSMSRVRLSLDEFCIATEHALGLRVILLQTAKISMAI